MGRAGGVVDGAELPRKLLEWGGNVAGVLGQQSQVRPHCFMWMLGVA